jgi:arylamine N-acetyltransferase
VSAVRCPEDASAWLVDVGFGGSHFGALPLAPHTAEHKPYQLCIERLPGERWRFSEKHFDAQSRYDFAAEPADETALAGKCSALRTDPDSTFVLNLVAQRRDPAPTGLIHHLLLSIIRIARWRTRGRIFAVRYRVDRYIA